MTLFLGRYWDSTGRQPVRVSGTFSEIQAGTAGLLSWESWLGAVSGVVEADQNAVPGLIGSAIPPSEQDGFDVMGQYLVAYLALGDTELVDVLSATTLEYDGMTGDPAAWWDWLDAVLAVLVVGESD